MAGKTKINGTAYTVKGGKTKVGGTGYSVKQGKTLIGGTSKSITFIPNNYLVKDGIVNNNSITGGMQAVKDPVKEGIVPTITYNGSSITVSKSSTGSLAEYGAGYFIGTNAINLTNYTYLKCNFLSHTYSSPYCQVRLVATNYEIKGGANYMVILSPADGVNRTGIQSYNISSLTGSYYVGIWIYLWSVSTTFTDLWLE